MTRSGLKLEWTAQRVSEHHVVHTAEVRGRFRNLLDLRVEEWPGQSNWLVNGAHDHAPTAIEAMRAAEEYALEALSEGVAAFGVAE